MSGFNGVIVVNIDDSQEYEKTVERNYVGTSNQNRDVYNDYIITGMNIENKRGTLQKRSSIDTHIWNNYIPSEFPISMMNIEDTKAICDIGKPHIGYTMKATVGYDDILDGEAKIYDPNGQLCAELYYERGEITGECKLYYESGELFFDGYFEKGYRSGRGIEYSKSGKNEFDGFYKNGRRDLKIERNKEHYKYWNEVDDSGKILCICKKNYKGLNDGVCYFFENGKINKISKWKDGEEVAILYEFQGSDMIIYECGRIGYKGPYTRLSDFKYVPTGE